MQFQPIPTAAALLLQLIQHLLAQHVPPAVGAGSQPPQPVILRPAGSTTEAAPATATVPAHTPAAAEPAAALEPLSEPKLVLTGFLPQPEPQLRQQPSAARLHGPDTEPLQVDHELILQAILQPKPQPLLPTRPLLVTEQEQQQQPTGISGTDGELTEGLPKPQLLLQNFFVQPRAHQGQQQHQLVLHHQMAQHSAVAPLPSLLPAPQSVAFQQPPLWCVTKERAAAAQLAPVDSMAR